MNRNRHGAKRRRQRIRLWDYASARGVVPYVASIMASIREHWLEAVGHDLRVRRLVTSTGRPNRDRLVAHAEAVTGGRRDLPGSLGRKAGSREVVPLELAETEGHQRRYQLGAWPRSRLDESDRHIGEAGGAFQLAAQLP